MSANEFIEVPHTIGCTILVGISHHLKATDG